MIKHFLGKASALTLILLCHSISYSQETVQRALSAFDGIISTASIDVIIENGSTFETTIQTENISAENIITVVKNNVLHISLKRGNFWNAKAKVFVKAPQLRLIHLSGAGNITAKDPIKSEDLEVKLTSAGNIFLKYLIVNELHIDLIGTGDIRLGGSAEDAEIHLTGSGDIMAFGMKTLRCKAEINGAGNIKLLAQDYLDAWISGSGDIIYKGNPTIERVKGAGSGEVLAFR